MKTKPLARSVMLAISMLIASSSNGQFTACIQEVIDCMETLYRINAPDYTQAIHLHYSVEATDWENSIVESNVKIYREGKLVHLFSDQADMIQDGNESFVILHNQKSIMYTKLPPRETNSSALNGLQGLQKEYLKGCNVLRCQDLGDGKKLLELRPTDSALGALPIQGIKYWYNIKTKTILRVETTFKSSYQLKRLVQNILTINEDSNYQLGLTAKAYLFQEKGVLKAKFTNYQFINN